MSTFYLVLTVPMTITQTSAEKIIHLLTSDPKKALESARSWMITKCHSLSDKIMILSLEDGVTYSPDEITGRWSAKDGVSLHPRGTVVFQAILSSHAYDRRVLWIESLEQEEFRLMVNDGCNAVTDGEECLLGGCA